MRKARDVSDEYQKLLLEEMSARYETAVGLTVMYPGVFEGPNFVSANASIGYMHQ